MPKVLEQHGRYEKKLNKNGQEFIWLRMETSGRHLVSMVINLQIP
jgi:hypothetical protein